MNHLQKVYANFSFRFCDGLGDLFARMFPDSEIVKKFKMQRTKCSYLVFYGIAPNFKGILQRKVMASPSFAVLYDESFSRVTKDEQMDLVVKFWEGPLVVTRYWESKFLGHVTAADLQKTFNEGMEGLPCDKMCQTGMDGPNANLKMYSNLVLELQVALICWTWELVVCIQSTMPLNVEKMPQTWSSTEH